jgi:hypothetical protein
MTIYSGNYIGDIAFGAGDSADNLLTVSGYVYVREGATFTAPALVKSGYVYVSKGATFTAPALVEVSGYVDVSKGATFTAPKLVNKELIFYEIASSGHVLFANRTCCKSGCRGPFSHDDGLIHWNRKDVRAVDFTAAIKAHISNLALA